VTFGSDGVGGVAGLDDGAGVPGAGVLGAGVLGAGVLGAGVLGAGVLGAGVLGAGVLGAGVAVLVTVGAAGAWATVVPHAASPSVPAARAMMTSLIAHLPRLDVSFSG
jgi:hypothetical protein